jgi:hypothetical protein
VLRLTVPGPRRQRPGPCSTCRGPWPPFLNLSHAGRCVPRPAGVSMTRRPAPQPSDQVPARERGASSPTCQQSWWVHSAALRDRTLYNPVATGVCLLRHFVRTHARRLYRRRSPRLRRVVAAGAGGRSSRCSWSSTDRGRLPLMPANGERSSSMRCVLCHGRRVWLLQYNP